MPLTLLVRSTEPDAPRALTFDGPRVVIGRGPGCDVRLPDPSVSHRHASVRIDAGEHMLVDEGSQNGTFVGGVRLTPLAPRAIKSGDLVRVGRVWLEVLIDQTPATRDLAAATRDLALALVSQAMRALGDDVVAKACVVEGKDRGATLALDDEGRAYVIGRGDGCDLPLEEADASREHLQLVRRGTVVLVCDLDSKNGVFLGNARLHAGRDVAWKPSLMLRVGKTVLALQEPVASALAELEAAPDEPLATEDIPPSPEPAPPPSSRESAAPPGGSARRAPKQAAPAVELGREGHEVAAPRARSKRLPWSAADITVVVLALLVLAASAAGLVWLLRP